MFKQTILFALVLSVGAVVCHDEQQEQVAAEVSSTQAPGSAGALKNGLLDLALIGAKGAQRVAHESRPTLGQLRKTVDEGAKSLGKRLQNNQRLAGVWNQLASNKHVERAKNSLKPLAKNAGEQYGKLSEKSKPLIDRAAAKAKPLIEQAKHKGQEVLAEHEARQAQLKGQQESARVEPEAQQ